MSPINEKWPEICQVFAEGFASSFHFSIATVTGGNAPHVAPIGSLLLDPAEPKGLYFDIFSKQTRLNLDEGSSVCVLAVNSGKGFWLASLLKRKFPRHPGIRLFGTPGPRREATPEEVNRWRRKTRLLTWTPGYNDLWGNLKLVRELTFHRYETLNLGRSTRGLW